MDHNFQISNIILTDGLTTVNVQRVWIYALLIDNKLILVVCLIKKTHDTQLIRHNE